MTKRVFSKGQCVLKLALLLLCNNQNDSSNTNIKTNKILPALWSTDACLACKIIFSIKTLVLSSFFLRYLYFPVFVVRMRRNTINHKGNILFAFLCCHPPVGISSFTFFTTMLSLPLWKTANILDLRFQRLLGDSTSTYMGKFVNR